MKWPKALALVAKDCKPSELARVVGVSRETVRRWLLGERIPGAGHWRALVIEAKLGDRWAELSAARDAVARKPGRPRLADEEYAAGVVARRNKKEVQNG